MGCCDWRKYPTYTEGFFIREKIAQQKKEKYSDKKYNVFKRLIVENYRGEKFNEEFIETLVRYLRPSYNCDKKTIYFLLRQLNNLEKWLRYYHAITYQVPESFTEEAYDIILSNAGDY